MGLFQERKHHKSIKTHFFILIAVVLANGGLLPTTGHFLLIFCIIVKPDEISSLNIHQNSIEIHFLIMIAVVLANGGLLLTMVHYLLTFFIIVNVDAINGLKYSPKGHFPIMFTRLVANGKLLLIMGDLFCVIGWE